MNVHAQWIEEAKQSVLSHFTDIDHEISCREVLGYCENLLQDICEEEECSQDWCSMACDYCKNIYYPKNFPVYWSSGEEEAIQVYLEILDVVLEREKAALPFNPTRDFDMPTAKEQESSEIKEEYHRYLRLFDEIHLYAFLRLSRECTPFDTLGHVAGVHHIAMYIARQFNKVGGNVDLALMSAAAILHDMGKFGCRAMEARRVPYLHYYYSDEFADKYGLNIIGHIAVNHSVWDLELDNLSFENLLLIYADFRSKSIRVDGKERAVFWSLKDSYDVILSKLDNVDDAKRRRYARAYNKLKDFEDFMVRKGVNPGLTEDGVPCGSAIRAESRDVSLLNYEEQRIRLQDMSIASNLQVMDILSHEIRFVDLLEDMRGEKDWRNVRSYLNVIGKYSKYVTKRQKDMLLDALYELLINPDSDLRLQSAYIIGEIIAGYEATYRKEIPQGYLLNYKGSSPRQVWANMLHRILFPDHRITSRERRWLGYAMKNGWRSLMENSSESLRKECLEELLEIYRTKNPDYLTTFLLSDCAIRIYPFDCNIYQQKLLFDFQMRCILHEETELRITASYFFVSWLQQGFQPDRFQKAALLNVSRMLDRITFSDEEEEISYVVTPAEQYLHGLITRLIEASESGRQIVEAEKNLLLPETNWSAIYWENQKRETPWIVKMVNLEMLEKHHAMNGDVTLFQYATHLTNLLQTAEQIVVRRYCGEMLKNIFGRLTVAERYEIAQELLRGLEVGSYTSGRYIPVYFGELYASLIPINRQELLGRFREMLDSNRTASALLTLETAGKALERVVSLHDDVEYHEDRKELRGLLLRGLAHYKKEIAEEAFYLIGHNLFGTSSLSLADKESLLQEFGKKLLMMLKPDKKGQALYNHASAFQSIYAFMSEYRHEIGTFPWVEQKPAAFFPGTFDPFSMGHKQIVISLCEMGFEVYMALDEFSWSKRTQGMEIRRKILEMSVADIPDTCLFPVDYPINIANRRDIVTLKGIFGERSFYLAVGADVPLNASAYRLEPGEDTVHSLNHILFLRAGSSFDHDELSAGITGEVKLLNLPEQFNEISSTRIRGNIDQNRDISQLVDTNARNYIYDQKLYSQEPVFKRVLKNTAIAVGTEQKDSDHTVFISDMKRRGRKVGELHYEETSIQNAGKLGESVDTIKWIRATLSGKILLLKSITAEDETYKQMLLTEFFAMCLEKEITWIICQQPGEHRLILQRQGFVPMPHSEAGMYVDLKNPIIIIGDHDLGVKDPIASDPVYLEAGIHCRRRLQKSLCRLYPGNLVLLLESEIMNNRLIQKITQANDVPNIPTVPRKLGKLMCVPFGSIIRGALVPNTVTKSLDIERFYDPDMENFRFCEYPGYANVQNQIRAIRSFDRPVILVDNQFHTGVRMTAIKPILDQEQVEVSKVIVGFLSANGRDFAEEQNLDVECVYFLPNIRARFSEHVFYPFMGGMTVDTGEGKERSLTFLPSVNPILPYQVPDSLEDVSREDFYEFSRTCLENAKELWTAIEEVYRRIYGRRLTVMRLGEVLYQPRIPNMGISREPDENVYPTDYIDYELARLVRIKRSDRMR